MKLQYLVQYIALFHAVYRNRYRKSIQTSAANQYKALLPDHLYHLYHLILWWNLSSLLGMVSSRITPPPSEGHDASLRSKTYMSRNIVQNVLLKTSEKKNFYQLISNERGCSVCISFWRCSWNRNEEDINSDNYTITWLKYVRVIYV